MKATAMGAILASLVISGCNSTTSPEKYALRQQLYRGSPAIKQDFINYCSERYRKRNSTPEAAADLAKLVNSSVQAAPRVGCQRVANAIASGRLTYEEHRKDVEQDSLTPTMARILQGQ